MTTTGSRAYPLRVSAQRDDRLSRWLWLVKWVLAIPHFVCLAFLWLAFVVFTVVAGVAILLTGRYPASIFDFNVGVLRWTWRVQHYSYGALGTDRYPPFTLADVPDYPARLEIDRPERLSRGLVLIKWWLLAIPHYLIVALFVGGIGPVLGSGGPFRWFIGGLVGVLVLAAGIVLAFTGRYPGQVYDVAVGMDRWALRVAAYAALMTDEYPPFRLDAGGADPSGLDVGPPAPPSTPSSAPEGEAVRPSLPGAPDVQAGWTARRAIAVVAGALVTLVGAGLLAGGGAMLWADQTQRTDGLLMTGTRHYDTGTRALVSERVELPEVPFGLASLLGRVQVSVAAADGSPRFVGVAPTGQVDAYLRGVSRATIPDLTSSQQPIVSSGDQVPGSPSAAGIWAADVSGPTPQTLSWDAKGGDWTFVIMRPDGGSGLDATVRAGAEVPALTEIAGGALGLGGFLLVAGILLLVVPVARASHLSGPPAPAMAAPAPAPVP